MCIRDRIRAPELDAHEFAGELALSGDLRVDVDLHAAQQEHDEGAVGDQVKDARHGDVEAEPELEPGVRGAGELRLLGAVGGGAEGQTGAVEADLGDDREAIPAIAEPQP